MRGSVGGREQKLASNQGLGALWPCPGHFQKVSLVPSWNQVGSIPQGGAQWAGGKEGGCGSGDQVANTSFIAYSPASLGKGQLVCAWPWDAEMLQL